MSLFAHIALFLVGVIYAGNYIVAKGIMPEMVGPSGFIVLRVVAGTIMFFSLMFIRVLFSRGRRVESMLIDKADIGRLVICGICGVAVNQLFFFNGLSLTSPVHASLIMTVSPIFVLIISAILLNNKITVRKIAGIFFGGTGAGLLLLLGASGHSDGAGASWQGDALILVNAISYGIYLVVVKPLMNKYSPLTVIAWVFLFGTIFVLPFGMGQVMEIEWSEFTADHWKALGFVILGTTFLAYLLNIYALTKVEPVVVSIYIYLQPLLVLALVSVLGYLGLSSYHNDLTILNAICALGIFTGVWLVSIPKGWISNGFKS
ncbi:MAG TPA: EamA/RhaT family transporter [Flavobacteriales bacterium]|nr:EamA/RhaT family transporter [Flavobacteriales bacterium]